MNCFGAVRCFAYCTAILLTMQLFYLSSSQSPSSAHAKILNQKNGTTYQDSPANPELTYILCGPLNSHIVQAVKHIVAAGRYPIVISTWEPITADDTTVLENLRDVIRLPMDSLLVHPKPALHPAWDRVYHIYEHIWAWQAALKQTSTRYAIKMRSSMFFSNVEHVSSIVMSRPKYYTISYFFRPVKESSEFLYHPSDFFVGLESSTMRVMLARAMEKVQRGGGDVWRVGPNNTMLPRASEQKLFTTFLEVVGVPSSEIEDNHCTAAMLTMMHVDLITLEDLGTYSMQCSSCLWINHTRTRTSEQGRGNGHHVIFSMSEVHEECSHCPGCLSKLQQVI